MENDETEIVRLPDLIARLHEVSAPEPVSMWPQTWGWTVIALILVSLIGWYTWRYYQRYRANAYRRDALYALDDAGNDAVVIANIVRRTALSAFPRQEVASLNGEAWLDFLANHSGQSDFARDQWLQLIHSPYRKTDQLADFNTLAKQWVLEHQIETDRKRERSA